MPPVDEENVMPITRELDNLKKLESAGFSHEQAETLADVIERSHVDSQESLKGFIHSEITGIHKELNGIHKELDNKTNNLRCELAGQISAEISNLHAEISRELKDLLIKIFGIMVGTIGVAVTILKLFP